MGRPVGVTIIAIIDFLGAALCVLFGIGIMVGGGFVATLINQGGGQGSGAGAGVLASLGVVLGVVLIVIAIIPALVGWGLWKLKEWARIVALVFAGLGVLSRLFGFISILAHFNIVTFTVTVCVLAYNVWVIWYLLQPDVKAAFQGAPARAAIA